MSLKAGPANSAFVHLTYLPWIATAASSRPSPPSTRAEAAQDRHPARCAAVPPRRPPLPEEEREKISLFTNVPEWGVISMWDVDTIYKVPRMLHEQGLDGLICDKLRLNTPPTSLKRWDELVHETEHPRAKCHRHGGQIRGPVGQLQVRQRSAAPRRHAEPCAREDRPPGFRNHRQRQRRRQAGQVRRHPGARRLWQPRRGRQDRHRPVCPRAQGALPGHLPGHAGGHHRIRRHVAGLEGAQLTEFDPRRPTP